MRKILGVLRIYLIVFLTLNTISCKSKMEQNTMDKSIKPKKDVSISNKKDKSVGKAVDFRRQDLIGVWAEREEENALYLIEEDSLYFVEHQDSPITYKLVKDTLYFNFTGFKAYSIIVNLTSDSLFLKDDSNSELLKLYKRKELEIK